jgi:hypothetical protein
VRSVLGPVAVHGSLWLAGLGMLRAAGVVPEAWSWRALAAGGLAYLVGIVGTLTVCLVVLIAGGPFTLPLFFAFAGVLALPALRDLLRMARTGSRRGGSRPRPAWLGERRGVRIALGLTLAALVGLLVVGLFTLSNRPIAGAGETDAWHIWMFRARLLSLDTHLPTAILGFAGDARINPHYNINPAYPWLLPLFEALHLRAVGTSAPSSAHLALWLLGVGFVWAGAFLAARMTRPLVWVPVFAGTLVLSRHALLSGYADVPVAYYLGLGTLALGLWLRSGRRSDLVLAALLMAGAAQIKNEGTAGAVAIVVAAGLVARFGPRTVPLRELLIATGAVALLAVLPWQLWVSAHHLQTEVPTGRYLDARYLAHHASRVWPSVRSLGAQLAIPTHVTLFVAPAVALAVLCLWQRQHRGLAAFYLLAGAGYFVTLVGADWVDTFPFGHLLSGSSYRLVDGVAMIAVAAIIQLSGSGPLTARRE